MLKILDDYDGSEARGREICEVFDRQLGQLRKETRKLDRGMVARAEALVARSPGEAFTFLDDGTAQLHSDIQVWKAGRFRCRSLGEMKAEVQGSGGLRLWLMEGTSPVTDIGALQGAADEATLFQVASQFNCLEAPSARLVKVQNYFHDPTQGPRASISAFPGTLLRHYAAPARDGSRFLQSDSHQLNLLRRLAWDDAATVESGYLRAAFVKNPSAWAERLREHFEELEVGVHEGVEVVLGANWDGPVEGRPVISQVFTSTLAAGMYGSVDFSHQEWQVIAQQLLRGAYLGTLLGAACSGQRRVVLTLIGGGVFGNPLELIWDSIVWACEQVKPHLPRDLTVVVNGRDLGQRMSLDRAQTDVRALGGEILLCNHDGTRLRR